MQIISQLKLFPRLLTPFAKINKGEGVNKQPPRLSRSFTGGKRNIFPSLKSKKTRRDQEQE